MTFCGKGMGQHIFIWFWMTGEWPPKGYTIDHKNRVPDDNRWENLRLATSSQQQMNTSRYGPLRGIQIRHNPSSGSTKYRARFRKRDQSVDLGQFDTLEEAVAAYRSKAKEVYGEFYCDD